MFTVLLTCLLAAPALAQTPVTTRIEPAANLGWPSSEGRRYQVQSSPDLRSWSPVGAPLVATGSSTSNFVPALQAQQFFRVLELPGTASNRISGLRQFLANPASPRIAGDLLELSNLRVVGNGIGLDDVVQARFLFDPVSQAFRLDGYRVNPGVGVYKDPYFARDNATLPSFTGAGSTLNPGVWYNANLPAQGLDVQLDLTVGHAPVVQFESVSAPVYLRPQGPGGVTNEVVIPDSGQTVFTAPWAATAAGRHVLRLQPVADAAATLRFRIDNANRNLLRVAVHGTQLNASLAVPWEYVKYRMELGANQLVTVARPTNRGVRFTLLDDWSQPVGQATGVALIVRAPRAGAYHLFIDHATGQTATYSGTLAIANP